MEKNNQVSKSSKKHTGGLNEQEEEKAL